MQLVSRVGAVVGVLVVGGVLAPGAVASALPTVSTAPGRPDAGLRCGDTVSRDAVLRADLTCHARGLRVLPGVTLDLGQHTVRIRERTSAAITVDARRGERPRTEIRNGTVSGGVGVVVRGTDDTIDEGRVQRVRIFDVTLDHAALRAANAGVSVVGSTVIESGVRLTGGNLDVVGSTLTGVRTSGEPAASGRPNAWRVSDSSITGTWWTAGDTTVTDSTIIDTSRPRQAPALYRNVTVTGSRLTGPAFRVVASGPRLTLGRSVVDDAGGFTAAHTLRLSHTKVRRSGWLTSDATSGRTVADHARLVGGKGLKGHRVEVAESTFASINRPVSGRVVTVSGSRFARNRGDTVNAYATLRAVDNLFLDNRGDALRTRGGVLLRNDVRRQRGDGIRYTATGASSSAFSSIRLGANQVLDGKGWGMLVTQSEGLDLVADLGRNVARGNGVGQCSPLLVCSDD